MKLGKSTILTIAGCVGVAITAVVAIKQGPKIQKLKDIPKEDKVKETVKAVAPVAVSAGATMGCVIFSHNIDAKTIAGLTATCGYLVKNRDEILKKVKEYTDVDILKEFRKDADHETFKQVYSGQTIEESNGGHSIVCLEAYSGRLFWSSCDAVRLAFENLNGRYYEGEYLSLNDLYEELGIQKTQFGDQYGWPGAESDYAEDFISYNAQICEDPDFGEILIVELDTYPMECWMEV